MIDGSPQVDQLSHERHACLVEMPLPMTKATHVRDTHAANLRNKHRAEPVSPEPHRLVANVDAALEQQILDIPQPPQRTQSIAQKARETPIERYFKLGSTDLAIDLGNGLWLSLNHHLLMTSRKAHGGEAPSAGVIDSWTPPFTPYSEPSR